MLSDQNTAELQKALTDAYMAGFYKGRSCVLDSLKSLRDTLGKSFQLTVNDVIDIVEQSIKE